VRCHTHAGFDELGTESGLERGGVGFIFGERSACDGVDSRGFESFVDMLDTRVCEGETVADERCGFVWKCLTEGFLVGHARWN
jgi:hypothetical protein